GLSQVLQNKKGSSFEEPLLKKFTSGSGVRRLDFHNIRGLRPLSPLHNVKLNILPFFQRFEPVPFECRIVHKHVLARFQPNKPKPLAIVEPFDSALGFHPGLLLSRVLEPCVSSRPATRERPASNALGTSSQDRGSIYHSP